MRHLILSTLILLSATGRAEGLRDSQPSHLFYQTIESPRLFSSVQLVRRNENIGLHIEDRLLLKKWVGISENAVVGIDGAGQVYSVLKLSDRVVAKRLSGIRSAKNIFLSAQGDLFALESTGALLNFRFNVWSKSPLSRIIYRQMRNWAMSSGVVTASLLVYSLWSGDTQALNWSREFWTEAGGVAVSTGMLSGFFGSLHFEFANELADGFMATGLSFPRLRIEGFEVDRHGLVDYILNQDKERFLLSDITLPWINQGQNNFDVTCEDELIARGIPTRYEFGY